MSQKLNYEKKIKEEIGKDFDISIIDLIDWLILHAFFSRASDIHINPTAENLEIQYRIDGAMQDIFKFPLRISGEIISRIKILSELRTDEHYSAQDGRFRFKTPDNILIDIRVSIVPTYYGENAVLRLLVDQSEEFTLEKLGFSKENLEKILHALRKPFGMILATGPTGSGKTTTLYTMIKKLRENKELSIITIEDPIEYAIKGVSQVQVNSLTGLTFARGLRAFLRQDPDVIMVGEIRDTETTSLAVNAALTGHLLLSTLHTNDAATTLPRFLDMGAEPFLVASTVNLAIGQRLVRKICPSCKKEIKLEENKFKILPQIFNYKIEPETKFFKGEGCQNCNFTGYYGRLGIQEVLVVDDDIRGAILKKVSAKEIKDIAVQKGMKSMFEDGIEKAKLGLTTLEEIIRVFYE